MEVLASLPWAGIGFFGCAVFGGLAGYIAVTGVGVDPASEAGLVVSFVLCFIAMCFFGMNL